MTKDFAQSLNSEVIWEELIKELEQISYPYER
jgi:hypothetical protein